MRLPREISAKELILQLKKYGYPGTIKIGTLSGIISDFAAHFNKSKEEIANELF